MGRKISADICALTLRLCRSYVTAASCAVRYNSHLVSALHPKLEITLKPLQGLECSVCEQIIDPKDVHTGSLLLLLARLKKVRFALCPSCTQEVPPGLQRSPEYKERWTLFVTKMVRMLKDGVKRHQFQAKPAK